MWALVWALSLGGGQNTYMRSFYVAAWLPHNMEAGFQGRTQRETETERDSQQQLRH